MKMSQMLGTRRSSPGQFDSHRQMSDLLLVGANLARPMGSAGTYSILPTGQRAIRKIEDIVRFEMDAAGAQQIHMPALQPRDLWERSGRYEAYGPNVFRLQDRRSRDLVLAPTHEEAVTQIAADNVQSYRDLPLMLYQIQTKFRDELRPRGGLIRTREFRMADAYSFDMDQTGLDASYDGMLRAYQRIFARIGVPAIVVDADSGAIGGKGSQEFIMLADAGEDTIILCEGCGYAANAEKSVFRKPPNPAEEPQAVEEVRTLGVKTIVELAEYMDVPVAKTLKTVFYMVDGELTFVVIRGDLEVNEIKLSNALGGPSELRLASDDEVAAAGVIAGSASPVGLSGVRVIADDSAALGVNFLAGANRDGYHLRGVNYPRDFAADIMSDIALAQSGFACARCGAELAERRGIEVGHIFKLGVQYSEALNACFTDWQGQRHPIVMGCFGIGIERLLAAAIERNHDEKGIVFPPAIAPYDVHLISLNRFTDDEARIVADRLYDALRHEGLEVLFDERDQSPGVKFNDADLLGMPVRAVVSSRTARRGLVEIKGRIELDATLALEGDAPAAIRAALAAWKPPPPHKTDAPIAAD